MPGAPGPDRPGCPLALCVGSARRSPPADGRGPDAPRGEADYQEIHTAGGEKTRAFTFEAVAHDGSPRDIDIELPPEMAESVWRVLTRDREQDGQAPASSAG